MTMPSKTILAQIAQLLFQVLAFYDVIHLESEEHLAVTAGLLALAGAFQRLATAKAEKAARRAAGELGPA